MALGSGDAVEPALTDQLTGLPVTIRVTRGIHTTVVDGGITVSTEDVVPGAAADTLKRLGVPLGTADQVSVTRVEDFVGTGRVGQLISINRGTQTELREIPAPTETRKDSSLEAGKSRTEREGKPGQKQVTFRYVFTPGTGYSEQVVSETVLSQPVAQIVVEGSKPKVAPVAAVAAPTGDTRKIGYDMMLARGWGADQWSCLEPLWSRESGWRTTAGNASGAYGIPQSYPGSKMASAGADWQTNPATQIAWGLGYIAGKYGSPCGAWSHWQVYHSY